MSDEQGDYLPPDGEAVGFNFNKPYVKPDGNNIGFNFKYLWYHPPKGNKIAFNFTQPYTPPKGNELSFNFSNDEDGYTPVRSTQYVYPDALFSELWGDQRVWLRSRWLNLSGFNALSVGTPSKVHNSRQYIQNVGGYSATSYGSAHILNFNKEIKTTGFNSLSFSLPKVFNSRQYIDNNNMGFLSQAFGTPFLIGGVKYVTPSGISSQQTGTPNVINTRADQYIQGQGITPLSFPSPTVSPRFLAPTGIKSDNFGQPFIQRSPSPIGFETSLYGVAWISHSPRHLLPAVVDGFNAGYPKVFDPTQKIGVTGANTVIAGGIFGDTSIRNTRRIIKVSGLYAQSFSDWGVVESNLRNIVPKGLDHQNFGSNAIRNKTPSIAPIGINSFTGLNAAIGYRIRTIKPIWFYQPKFGTHILTKPPELKPSGNNQNIFGSAWISHKTRSIYAGLGRESLAIGEINVWHFTRYLKPTGIFNDGYGTPRVEHGRRVLLAKGSTHSSFGDNSWLSYGVRSLAPISIDYPKIPNHRVGGTQNIQPFGYVATRFGSRIIPESQSIYPQGFINPFGISAIDLWKKYIKPNGFLTNGQEGGHRFGTHKFWNLRQYIVQFYDGDSGLVPPKWTGWTSIENRNKTIGAIGSNFARIGEPNIGNKARLLSANGLNALAFGQAMIADRIRRLKLQGLESPYFSGWSAIYNAAPVIAQKGFKADAFGITTILNTRRYFNRIGNFESLEFGKPMIADRIRTIKFEQRYSIAPPYIPIHKIHLHTRYIEEVGRFDDYQAFGNPSLSIHWNIITPRWTMRDVYGTPVVNNLTPEVQQRGHNSEEFGNTFVRTQWRELLQQGSETVLWGRSEIAFRDRQFSVVGFTQWAIPKHKVTKTGVPPYYPQYIWLDAVEIDGEQNDGHGIGLLEKQVPVPNVKTNVIFPVGFIASRYSNHHLQSNGILVKPGIQELNIGSHSVGLKKRLLKVPSINDSMVVSKPRLSPHTIYAGIVNPPLQAVENHERPHSPLHPIDGYWRNPGAVFGATSIANFHRRILQWGGYLGGFGNTTIQQTKFYIQPKGWNSLRVGMIAPIGDQTISFRHGLDIAAYGVATIQHIEAFHRSIKPNGRDALIFGGNEVQLFNRNIYPVGLHALLMGSKKNNDQPYMWQGLRIGEHIPTCIGGGDLSEFGTAWISLRVCEIHPVGLDCALVNEYDYTKFDERMRVVRREREISVQQIKPMGFNASMFNASDIKHKVHYIRPDGNSDQFRKGAF